MLWICLILTFSFANAALNYTRLVTGPSLNVDILDSTYPSNVILFCGDFALQQRQIIDRKFYFNEGSLSNNTELKASNNQPILAISHPTIDNSGKYDCCVKTAGNGTAQPEEITCFRTELIVTEYSHYVIENDAKVEISQKRNNYFAIFENSNVSMVVCKFNGSDLQANVKAMYANTTFNPFFTVFNQLVILETDAKNFGPYSCTGVESNAQVLSKNFTLSEAPARLYPWLGEGGKDVDPTDPNNNNNNDNNSAAGFQIASLLCFFVMSAFVF